MEIFANKSHFHMSHKADHVESILLVGIVLSILFNTLRCGMYLDIGTNFNFLFLFFLSFHHDYASGIQ